MRNNIIAACILFCSVAQAQQFRWEAAVDPVDTAGYTRILLHPEVTSRVSPGFSDIRIYDSANIEIPYLIAYDTIRKGTERLVELPITDKQTAPNNSSLTIMNPLHYDALDHLVLEVNNADAARRMSLSGSYDNVNWFTVKDQFTISSFENYSDGQSETSNLIRFDFPPNDYKYYRFSFDNWSEWWKEYRDPLFIVRAGRLERTTPVSVQENWIELPGVTIKQTENPALRMSEIDIVFADTQRVDFLKIDLSTLNPTGEFLRGARLYSITGEGLGSTPTQTLLSITMLSSAGENELRVNSEMVKHLVLRIINEDDQPLRVEAVHALQLKSYLIANLSPANKYKVCFGNDTLRFPQYDLRYFANTIAAETPVTGTGPRKAYSGKQVVKSEDSSALNSLFKNKIVLWGAILLVGLILGMMTVKMLREMKK